LKQEHDVSRKNRLAFSVLIIAGLGMFGCNKSPDKPVPTVVPVSSSTTDASKDEHGPDGWWCEEHGVPESICAQCSTKLAAEFKAKEDWCKKHDRPDSQCFICHPELEAKFAALYEAKFGKKPPKPTGG
jgi:cobalt-zinc-cadmium efflux system membrane fusion protein